MGSGKIRVAANGPVDASVSMDATAGSAAADTGNVAAE
jgi:hypothetical protein